MEGMNGIAAELLFSFRRVRVGITPRCGVEPQFPFPIFQNLLGEQQETDFKAIVGVSYNF